VSGDELPFEVDEELVAAVEALLFASGEPATVVALAEALGRGNAEVRAALEELERRRAGSGVVLERIAGGWQLRTAPRFALMIHRLVGTKPQKLSRPALEVLALVAYHQPIPRTEIERVRGVDSGGVLKSLLDRGLIRTAGRAEDPGRPLLYRTTPAFLELFSLPDLAALPTLAEREALVRAQPEGALPAPRIELVTDDDPG
jgi:segregation and condensation protein B